MATKKGGSIDFKKYIGFHGDKSNLGTKHCEIYRNCDK